MLVGGCASNAAGPEFESFAIIPPDRAILYLFRPANTWPPFQVVRVYAGNELVTALPEAGYYPIIAQPGCYKFRARWSGYYWMEPWTILRGNFHEIIALLEGRPWLNFRAEPGREYYIAFENWPGGGFGASLSVGFRPKDIGDGLSMLKTTRLVDGSNNITPLSDEQITKNHKRYEWRRQKNPNLPPAGPCGW